MTEQYKSYAYLPEDLLQEMLLKAPETAKQLAQSIDLNNSQIKEARRILENKKIIKQCGDSNYTTSIMAADGAYIIDHKASADVLMAIGVGIDGLSPKDSERWPKHSRQFQQWQGALPHHVANTRLIQGIMFLMELSILSESDREIRIMDGSHLTFILKINSLLSANDQDSADKPYVNALSDFLHRNYQKVIPDIPDIIKNAFSNTSIISLTKYSSSREIIDSKLTELDVRADDKIFMSTILKDNEYTIPMPVGQSRKEKQMWSNIHFICNLTIDSVNKEELEHYLQESILSFKITNEKESELFFCYYKPFSNTPAYRIELKKALAEDKEALEKVLASIKKQTIFPQIREPYPQYLVDIIAKNISFGMSAVNQAISNNEVLQRKEYFDLIFPYRT